MDFNLAKPYPSVVMTWIRFPGLLGHMYKKKILWEIRELVGKVAKLDLNTDNKVRGRYAQMAVYVNMEKPLISKVLINGKIQRIEYKSRRLFLVAVMVTLRKIVGDWKRCRQTWQG